MIYEEFSEEYLEVAGSNPALTTNIIRPILNMVKYKMSSERWTKAGQPTAGQKWFFIKENKKIWFIITEQGWTKTGVYLKLSKLK